MKRSLIILIVLAFVLGVGSTIAFQEGLMADKANAASLTACSATITGLVWQNDRYYLRFASGTEYEFDSLEAIAAYAEEIQTVDNAEKLAIAYWLARDDDLSNINIILGKKLTFDVSQPSPIKVQ